MSEEHTDHASTSKQPDQPVTATSTTPQAPPQSRSLRPIAIAIALFAGALIVTFVLIRSGGDDAAHLDATKITLELSYPVGAATTANLDGQQDAAPAGTTITCRTASSKQRIGQGTAGDDGAFDIALDATPWPPESLTRAGYSQLNQTLECRAGTGEWVQPLRQPRVNVN